MNIGTITAEGSGLTNAHPPVIISGKIKAGTECKMNGVLTLDKSTGEFEAYDFDSTTRAGAFFIALEPVAAESSGARVLLHGTFDGAAVVKANGDALSAAELAAVQSGSQIYFV